MVNIKHSLPKKIMAVILAVTMLLGTFGGAGLGVVASALGAVKAANVICGDLTFVVPEVIYLTPSTSTTSSFQYYVNNNSDGTTVAEAAQTTGKIYYAYSGASTATVSYQFYNDALSAAVSGGSVTLSGTTISSGGSVNITAGTSPAISTGGGGCYLEWRLSYTDTIDGKAKIAYAYTYIYRPYVSPVGAASFSLDKRENVWNGDDTELSIISWWSGIHGSKGNRPSFTNIGDPDGGSGSKYPNTKSDNATYYLNPLIEGTNASPNNINASNYLNTSGGKGLDSTIQYNTFYKADGGNKWTTAATTGPYAFIKVDSSRYTDLRQLPNYRFSTLLTDDKSTSSDMNYIINRTSNYFDGGVNNDDKKHSVYSSDGDTAIKSGSYGSTTEGYYYNDAYSVPITPNSNSVFEFGIESAFEGKDDDGWRYRIAYVCVATYCPIEITAVNKSALRTAVQKATKAMAKLGVNGSTNASLTSW